IWWFTPTVEAPLCGHATLAAAHVLWKHKLNADVTEIHFTSCSGLLIAKKQDDWIELDFPTEEASKLDIVPAIILEEFSEKIVFAGQNRIDYLVILHDESSVINYQPNLEKLTQLGRGIIVSAQSNNTSTELCQFFEIWLIVNN